MSAWMRKNQLELSVSGAWVGLLGICLLMLSACGGEGDVSIGSGQSVDPVIVDFPMAYVRRPVPRDDQNNFIQPDARELLDVEFGADLFLRDQASPSAPERNITGALTAGFGDVRDVSISADGQRLIFAMRFPIDPNLNDDDQPTWNIWEYEIPTDTLRRIVPSDITAEAGYDLAPAYLPDGRIVFASTRQRQAGAILLDEGKPQFPHLDEDRDEFALVLHVMNDDGSDIHQISLNQSHDLDPSMLDSGEVLFTRWNNMGGRNEMDLYKMHPDGTEIELVYGPNSHATGTNGSTIQFIRPRETEDGRILVIARPFTGTDAGGDLLLIDTPNYVENTQPTLANQGVLSGPAQVPATIVNVSTVPGPSEGGRFMDAYPLWDGTNRMLVSWSQCRLLDLTNQIGVDPVNGNPIFQPILCTPAGLADPNAVAAPPVYGIWIYDMVNDTQLPVVTAVEDFVFTDVVAAQLRGLPNSLPDKVVGGGLDPDYASEAVGALHIRSVYDFLGVDTAVPNIATLADPGATPADQRPARFLRLVKAVSIPDDDFLDFNNAAFGVSQNQLMREILGYAPIEPDGSVMIKVPANVAFAVSVLDANGRRITPRHQDWLQVLPGETFECNGCHNPGSGMSHGRTDAFATINDGAAATGVAWPNTDPAMSPDFGETMAETRARISCSTGTCDALDPNMDIDYVDVWTNPITLTPELPFSYSYGDLATIPPTYLRGNPSTACMNTPAVSNWSSDCRIIINYEQHIHPLWSVPRQVIDPVTLLVISDFTCTVCHSPADGAGVVQVPAGQLDLADGLSDIDNDHFKSYRELLSGDNALVVQGNALLDDSVVIGTDPVTGLPITAPIPVSPSMSPAGANNSGRFFDRFDPASGNAHATYLMTPAELKLLSEWLDIGAQYYNNPFDAPLN